MVHGWDRLLRSVNFVLSTWLCEVAVDTASPNTSFESALSIQLEDNLEDNFGDNLEDNKLQHQLKRNLLALHKGFESIHCFALDLTNTFSGKI